MPSFKNFSGTYNTACILRPKTWARSVSISGSASASSCSSSRHCPGRNSVSLDSCVLADEQLSAAHLKLKRLQAQNEEMRNYEHDETLTKMQQRDSSRMLLLAAKRGKKQEEIKQKNEMRKSLHAVRLKLVSAFKDFENSLQQSRVRARAAQHKEETIPGDETVGDTDISKRILQLEDRRMITSKRLRELKRELASAKKPIEQAQGRHGLHMGHEEKAQGVDRSTRAGGKANASRESRSLPAAGITYQKEEAEDENRTDRESENIKRRSGRKQRKGVKSTTGHNAEIFRLKKLSGELTVSISEHLFGCLPGT